MPTDQTFVIVGASLAGAKAAETLREEGFDGRVVLLGAEAERPYERPPLSKDYLRGETERQAATSTTTATTTGNDIELRICAPTVESIDPRRAPRSSSPAASGIGYDRLLLATGAEPRRLRDPRRRPRRHPLPAHGRPTPTRSRERIDGRRQAGRSIGAGWIGSEVAAVGPAARAAR